MLGLLPLKSVDALKSSNGASDVHCFRSSLHGGILAAEHTEGEAGNQKTSNGQMHHLIQVLEV